MTSILPTRVADEIRRACPIGPSERFSITVTLNAARDISPETREAIERLVLAAARQMTAPR